MLFENLVVLLNVLMSFLWKSFPRRREPIQVSGDASNPRKLDGSLPSQG